MSELLSPWTLVGGRVDPVWLAAAPTYPGGPTLVLSVHQAAADRLWYGVIAYEGALLPTWRSPSGFVKRTQAQQWAETKAESIPDGMLPFPLPGGDPQ